MSIVGKVTGFITQGVYSVATPFHPFGGAVDIIAVKQNDGTYRSTPWYVRFGKFQGVLKGAEKVVRIEVNGVEANFHMCLDNSGEAYFVREVDPDDDGESIKDSESIDGGRDDNSTEYSNFESVSKDNDFFDEEADEFNHGDIEVRDERATLGVKRLERVESDVDRIFYEFQDEQSSLEGSVDFSDYDSSRYDNLESVRHTLESENPSSEVVLVSVDGHILMAPISSSVDAENVQLSTPQFHLGPGDGAEEFDGGDDSWTSDYLTQLDTSAHGVTTGNICKETLSCKTDLEACESDGEHLNHVPEAQDLANQDKDPCVENRSGSTSSRFKRDVFKSCLELTEFSVQSANDDHENMSPSVESLDSTSQKSPLSPFVNDKPEEENLEISRDGDELSPHDSENPSSVSSPMLQVEAATHERNTFDMDHDGSDSMPVQFVSSDQESLKQVQVDPTVETINCGEVSPDSDASKKDHAELHTAESTGDTISDSLTRPEISLCGKLLQPGMGLSEAEDVFNANRISLDEFKLSATSIVKNEDLIVRLRGKYLPWDKAAHIILGMVAFGLNLPVELQDIIPVEQEKVVPKEDNSALSPTPSRRWRLWPIPFRRVKTLEHATSNSSNEEVFIGSDTVSQSELADATPKSRLSIESPRKQIIRTNVPTSDQIASLNLKEGQNMVNFIFSTRVLGSQKVEAHIYLWKWNTRIVISDVDGTITKSDVLGQFMPLVGKDWTHSGIAHLFSAIKENGYQLLFLSARAIVQAYLTKSFLFNLKQDGKSLPNGPVVISPDGLFPSLYREVIRRAPHEFKIACLEDIKALFPPDYNPFYAGFGNRDTDELSYRKIGIPKGKIFIINPKGEVAINHRIDVKSYTSLHTLVNDMFPPTSLVEQEDFNSWNYWKVPLPDIDNL
ncbi:hypothetical protein ACS0TY_016205 [Phlomoides rotata]